MQAYVSSKNIVNTVLAKPISADEDLRVRLEQTELLLSVSPYLIITSGLMAVFFAAMQWNAVAHDTILIWLASLESLLALRMFVVYKTPLSHPDIHAMMRWKEYYIVSILSVGLVWGSAGIYLLPEGNIEAQVLTVFTLLLIVGGLALNPMVWWAAFIAFLLSVMLPLIIQLLLLGTDMALKLSVFCVFYTTYLILHSHTSYKVHMRNILFQVRYLDHEKITQASQYMSEQTAEILKMVAIGKPAKNIYDVILQLYESRYEGLRCSILILRSNRLFHVSAPSLPKDYNSVINGVEIGENIGSCGTSAYLGKRVLVEDIANDIKWQAFKDVTLPHGMRSCWSEPIFDAKGKVLGTLAMYHDVAGLPSEQELHTT